MEGDYDGSTYSSRRHARAAAQMAEAGVDEDCELPDGGWANSDPRDPLHIQENRDIHGYGSKRWNWFLGACEIIAYNVTFKMAGSAEHVDAVLVTFNVALEDPQGRSVVEQRDTALISESTTVLNWTLKPGAPVEPGEWQLSYAASGDYQYEVEVYLEY